MSSLIFMSRIRSSLKAISIEVILPTSFGLVVLLRSAFIVLMPIIATVGAHFKVATYLDLDNRSFYFEA